MLSKISTEMRYGVKTFDLVRQTEGSSLCGQAVVATLLRITLDESVRAFGTRGATRTRQIVAVLRGRGIECPDRMERFRGRLPARGILKVKFWKARMGHWVLWFDGRLYDPAVGTFEGLKLPLVARVTSFLPIRFSS